MTHLIRQVTGTASILLASLLLVAPAEAETVILPHATLVVTVPEGYCALDPTSPAEAEVMRLVKALQEGQNRVLLQFVECEELELWRSAIVDEFTEFGQVMLPLSEGVVQPIPLERAAFLQEMVNYLPAADDDLLEELERAVNENEYGMTIEDLQFLGLLAQDENGLYVGLIGRPSFEGETGELQAGLMSMTLIRDTVVSCYLYRPYEGDGDFEQLIAEQQAYLADLIAANP